MSESIDTKYAEAEQLRGLLAADVESTADLQETADFEDENSTDRTTTTANDRPYAVSVDAQGNPANDASTADLIAIDDLPRAPMPEQRALGFFAFAVCAVVAILFTTQRHTESSHPKTKATLVATALTEDTKLRRTVGGGNTGLRDMEKVAETRATQSAEGKRESAGTSATFGLVTFESRSFATSERAVAAVFIVKRTQAVRGRALVQWAAHSGSADAGIDFSDASGTARFADGQRQLAIYVPLRNDLLKEEDETFKVCLRSPRQARIGVKSCAEATIRDDDDASRI